ncbi:RsmB/NOP family class I SAM-dependent RNA methyltransferase [Kingella negevensis]|uniref:RsmB/NOP family class I SAM-dependent RNA methyltransferase n=1 Tax=Kingella negevensis TaxID=1522312 RepID=UPI00254DA4F8|nr:RsmB/NOP family class I SAM-dependent RNA methyltransferase [Kingella negevensis]MDK4680845.1 RsmB/NOP family class I SAM-dependent RNA methyltransferase [Kingella negevensis]MDK4681432.1 RsmB/NOP family class I SAM-dependent RNA methyltransferase [Kingella negevensis]MDK4684921.1 RsmB/NOP family class I SAM-dependent RNA methyltransferase [Kingella negevensis]MDK4691818.1 RsmB/NOP family class I SAM-dependent RNA methyltransferase [Kingella negevensis]MDK4693028.1 RsmB/NOP family class I S
MNQTQLNHTAAVLAKILTFNDPADVVLSNYLRNNRKLGRADRHEIAETAFAAIRHYQKIAAAIRRPHVQARKAALAALVLGRSVNISQIEELLNEEDGKKEFLSSLKARKAEFLGSLNTATELPEWLIDVLKTHWSDEEILAFGRSVTQPAPLDVRVNTLNGKRDKILAQLQTEFPNAIATPFAPNGIRFPNKPALNKHPLFLDGTIEVQDEGSQLLAQLVGAKRGEMVVDFCAGAGGKTLAIGAQMANKGRIYAFDIAEKRLANLKPRMTRAGLTNIHPEKISNEHDPRIARLNGKADRVLVDAPCSGLGTLRRNPDLKYRQSPETLANLLKQQQSIFQAASQLVKSGGRLVYATCSILPEENEMQVAEFLKNNSDFELVNCAELLVAQKIDLDTGEFLKMNTAEHNTDGFFAAVLQRK